jgi:hypothetical protein
MPDHPDSCARFGLVLIHESMSNVEYTMYPDSSTVHTRSGRTTYWADHAPREMTAYE